MKNSPLLPTIARSYVKAYPDLTAHDLATVLEEAHALHQMPELMQLIEEEGMKQKKFRYTQVTSALPLTDAQRTSLSKALEKRFGMPVMLQEEVRADLIGGLKIFSHSWSYDGSVRGRLTRLAQALKT
jgi:F-type H+-transporting ATPase subunit delta